MGTDAVLIVGVAMSITVVPVLAEISGDRKVSGGYPGEVAMASVGPIDPVAQERTLIAVPRPSSW